MKQKWLLALLTGTVLVFTGCSTQGTDNKGPIQKEERVQLPDYQAGVERKMLQKVVNMANEMEMPQYLPVENQDSILVNITSAVLKDGKREDVSISVGGQDDMGLPSPLYTWTASTAQGKNVKKSSKPEVSENGVDYFVHKRIDNDGKMVTFKKDDFYYSVGDMFGIADEEELLKMAKSSEYKPENQALTLTYSDAKFPSEIPFKKPEMEVSATIGQIAGEGGSQVTLMLGYYGEREGDFVRVTIDKELPPLAPDEFEKSFTMKDGTEVKYTIYKKHKNYQAFFKDDNTGLLYFIQFGSTKNFSEDDLKDFISNMK